MATIGLDRRERTMAALVAATLVALLVWGLVAALAIAPRRLADSALKVFGVELPPPPPPPERPPPPHRPSTRASGAAAPPALRAQATPVVAPPPVIVTPTPPPPLVAAPVPNAGAAASQGAADLPGPGTGAGGEGDGYGSGGAGRGDGAGDVPPRQIHGRIRDSDYPPEAARAGAQGTVVVRYYVGPDGSASRCQVTESSGNAALDATTCRLIEQRFRFRPGHDARGRPFGAWLEDNHEEWVLARAPDGDE